MELEIKISQLSEAVRTQLDRYSDEVRRTVDQAALDAASGAVEELKRTSPKRSKKGKRYHKGWSIQEVQFSRVRGTVAQIYNKSKPSLTHLLEHGHAMANGGRVEGIPHIAPAEKRAEEAFISALERKLGEL